MKRLLIARLLLVGIGLLVWGYGNATSQPRLMYAGMGVIFVALLLRFAQRWLDRPPR
jgi:hypothetical protein